MPQTSEASARAHIRRESLDIYNRLRSIQVDVAFVNQVRAAYPAFPLIPNLRCGAWYTDPVIAHPTAHAYFKSTDGHHGNWAFNLRRPNIHLLPIATAHGGLILVDSTRAGKRLPDALSKTIPIWCAVVNRAARLRGLRDKRRLTADAAGKVEGKEEEETQDANNDDDITAAADDLRTPPGAVSAHEHVQIVARLEGWATALADSSYTLPELTRPLRPLWITPASACFPHVAPDASLLPIICVSASRAVDEGTERRTGGFSYVQGSGDDHELWGQGLTPQLFWRHRAELLSCSREELEAIVAKLVATARETEGPLPGRDGPLHGASWRAPPTPVRKVGGRVLLCALTDLPRDLLVDVPGTCEPKDDRETAFVVVDASEDASGDVDEPPLTGVRSDARESEAAPRVLRVHVPLGRRGRHIFVHEVLPRTVSFARSHLGLGRKICVAGGDEGIGVALVLLQLFFADDGSCLCNGTPKDGSAIRKSSVRTRLEWIIASQPEVNPTRAILKRVNDFLLSPHLQF